jgi:hypothetical protein
MAGDFARIRQAMRSSVHLSIGCELRLHCDAPTPLLVVVHPHRSLAGSLRSREAVALRPDRSFELLTDASGNRWSRLIAASGLTTFRYGATIERPDSTDPVLPATPACPVQALPIDTYRFLNASTHCDTTALMQLAWQTFGHLAITLCRCLNLPARYCTGYLGYTGIPVGTAPVDFSAWFGCSAAIAGTPPMRTTTFPAAAGC